jgi:hypothetical protein
MRAIQGIAVSTVAVLANTTLLHAGPCTRQIAQTEQQIAALQASPEPAGPGLPTAPQSVDAQLHHQPTPGSVGSAENTADADAAAALERARRADAAGDASACSDALNAAKRLYTID